MFKRFYKTAPAPATPATHIVRDRHTKRVLMTGTYAMCQAYLNAFGTCYLEAIA